MMQWRWWQWRPTATEDDFNKDKNKYKNATIKQCDGREIGRTRMTVAATDDGQ
jgi:hypothetical protein